MGYRVILTEETDWIGGQLTSQAVPPDEHPWIEQFGCTALYRQYRNLVRRFYREHMRLSPKVGSQIQFNPGGGWVSKLCHEPRIGWVVLNQMMQPFLTTGRLDIRLFTVATSASMVADRVESVTLFSRLEGTECTVTPRYVIDATELGDLLPLTSTEYVIGAESKSQTFEPNAVDGEPEPQNIQGFTWVFAMAHDDGSHRVIDKPVQYDHWKKYQPAFWPGPFLGFEDINPQTGQMRHLPIFSGKPVSWFNGDFGLFSYRQIVDPDNHEKGWVPHPITIVNWPQNDYFEGSILDVPLEGKANHLLNARELSLSLLYWLQTEAPRHDGGEGYPGLYLRPDVMGTSDGFAKAPYIREGRRIVARSTVLEQDIAAYTHSGLDRAPEVGDSVGIGSYRIDLHPSTNGKSYIDTSTLPFQIPLGSLVPMRVQNLLPGCKNLGVTHITNGCYRLHPVEWNIGESAGLLASYCLSNNTTPQQVHDSKVKTMDFQNLITSQGVEIAWPRLKPL